MAVAALPLVLLAMVPAPSPAAGTLVAAIVPVPVAAILAPVPTTMAAVVLVPPVTALHAVEAVPARLEACHVPDVELYTRQVPLLGAVADTGTPCSLVAFPLPPPPATCCASASPANAAIISATRLIVRYLPSRPPAPWWP